MFGPTGRPPAHIEAPPQLNMHPPPLLHHSSGGGIGPQVPMNMSQRHYIPPPNSSAIIEAPPQVNTQQK
jgi:hypothetical protein